MSSDRTPAEALARARWDRELDPDHPWYVAWDDVPPRLRQEQVEFAETDIEPMTAERAHGTRARYVFGATGNDWRNGCRCFECSAAAVLYEKRRQRARARGEVAYVDATEARRHLLFLRANGVGRRGVAAASGVSPSQVSKIARGAVTKIRPATAERILAVHLGRTPAGSYVDATRTLAQIDDLVHVVGMTRTAIAQALGYRTPALQIGKDGRVTKANADRVEALWQERMRPILVEREHERAKRAMHRERQREAVAP